MQVATDYSVPTFFVYVLLLHAFFSDSIADSDASAASNGGK